MFLFGRSYGGLIATNMASTIVGKSMFSGVVLLTPYYRLYTERLYESYKLLLPISKIYPNYVITSEFAEIDEEYMERYKVMLEDPRNLNFFTATTGKIWVEE